MSDREIELLFKFAATILYLMFLDWLDRLKLVIIRTFYAESDGFDPHYEFSRPVRSLGRR